MHGNVWEWRSDWYGDSAVEEQRDPVRPASGELRVARGGSWDGLAWNCRSARRRRLAPVSRT